MSSPRGRPYRPQGVSTASTLSPDHRPNSYFDPSSPGLTHSCLQRSWRRVEHGLLRSRRFRSVHAWRLAPTAIPCRRRQTGADRPRETLDNCSRHLPAAGARPPGDSRHRHTRGRGFRDRPNGGLIAPLKDPWFRALLWRRIGDVPLAPRRPRAVAAPPHAGVRVRGGGGGLRPVRGGWAGRRPDPRAPGGVDTQGPSPRSPADECRSAYDRAARTIFPLPDRGVRSRDVGADSRRTGVMALGRVSHRQGWGDADPAGRVPRDRSHRANWPSTVAFLTPRPGAPEPAIDWS